jgi:hypothetical protein
MERMNLRTSAALIIALVTANAQPPRLAPASMPRVANVEERFQSYNIEMVEVTGGRFWKPYREIDALLDSQAAARRENGRGATPAGMNPNLYQYRPPIDLANPRLRKLAAALGPAYVRVSGTWANNTWFQDSGAPAPKTPPEGFGGILTREQWKGVVDFARAVNARLVTSFATSTGTRDAAGTWTPAQARALLDYTKAIGGAIAAAEFMNEPTYAEIGGAPKGYDAAAFNRDLRVFIPFLKQASPGTVLLGPGGVGEGVQLGAGGSGLHTISSEDILKATGPAFDAFSYHSYSGVSKRCTAMAPIPQPTPDAALTVDQLARAERIEQFYAELRDRFDPGKPLWLTETAEAACGGDSWAATFLDSFRYLDQMGRLARRGVQVHMHNTLASSDYGLLDEDSFAPRPNYWAALLWKKLMGGTVLDPGPSPAPALRLYAHCLPGRSGGVTLLAINTGRAESQSIDVPAAAERFTLSAAQLEDRTVQLNGSELRLGAGDALPELAGVATPAGKVSFAPATITFLAIPEARNGSCR